MASLKKYGDGWRVWLTVKGQRDSRTFPSKKEAQLWAESRTIELRAMASGRAGEIKTTHDAFDRYKEEVSPNHKGERWELVRLDKFKKDFPRVPLAQLRAEHIVRWRDQRLTVVSDASVLREMKLLNQVLEQCRKEWGWIQANPAKDVRKPSSPEGRSRVITRSEIRRVLRALGYPALALPRHAAARAFLLALRTGMRASELAGIEWKNVSEKVIRIPDTKNGSIRDVPLSAKARRLVAGMRGYHETSVFNVTAGSLDVQFRGAKARAGLSGFTFHDSRHTAATWIGQSGKLTLLEFCKTFGWKDPRHALVYFNPSASDLADKM